MLTPVRIGTPEGSAILARLLDRFQIADRRCQEEVAAIIERVTVEGDNALLDYTRRFDCPGFRRGQFRVSKKELRDAYREVPAALRQSLELAIDRIHSFHEREREESWVMTRDDGTITGRMVHPVPAAGLYVPGGTSGKTPLVSSVLMNGIPAAIAGVERRVMVTPPNAESRVEPALLVAAQEIGVTEIYKVGSAWAIAALALGTDSIPRVDVVCGPGNRYVTEAKRQLSGRVRIDMIAGPSEVLIVADGTAEPAFIAADLLAQAEHDPAALAVLVATDSRVAAAVLVELERQLAGLERQEIARESLANRGAILLVEDLDEALFLANQIAPEHLELMVHEPFQWLSRVSHAGAVFIGPHSPEAMGDYVAGPNHVLPTMGTARFSSALGVETFLKKTSVIAYAREAFLADAAHVERLATLEGLTGHARSVQVRRGNAV
ncbi:MAG: histidinol dehydrogenase [Thermodesulfobacteriota bacterium]